MCIPFLLSIHNHVSLYDVACALHVCVDLYGQYNIDKVCINNKTVPEVKNTFFTRLPSTVLQYYTCLSLIFRFFSNAAPNPPSTVCHAPVANQDLARQFFIQSAIAYMMGNTHRFSTPCLLKAPPAITAHSCPTTFLLAPAP